MSGGSEGKPDIFEVRKSGDNWEGHFGTNTEYAPFVIGENTQAAHMSHWWKISAVVEAAKEKLDKIFETLAEKMAQFLSRKGAV